jgi:hypothetical protein
VLRAEREYLMRNEDIVEEVETLIATPRTTVPSSGSGTWWTVRFAATVKRRTILVFPDGSIEQRYGRAA